MMQQHVRRAGRADAEERADDSRGGHRGFEGVGLEPLIEEIGGTHGHELDKIVFVFRRQRLEALAEEGEFFQVARIEGCGVGRNHAENRFDETAHRDHGFAELFVGFGVELGVALDFAARLRVIIDAPEIIAIGHRRERAVEREDFQPVAREIEIANNFRAQQRDDIRKNGKLKTGDDFFGDGCAAEHVAAFEDEDFFPRAGEIGRVHKAVVAAADHDCVVSFRHRGILKVFPGSRSACARNDLRMWFTGAEAFYRRMRLVTRTNS